MRGIILAAGELLYDESYVEELQNADYILCADGGYDHAIALGIVPHMIIGDMDSVKASLPKKGILLNTAKKKKDETDTQLAIHILLEWGCTSITIIGGTGGRLDHTLANMSLLFHIAEKGATACLLSGKMRCRPLMGQLCIAGKKGDVVSVLPFGNRVEGIRTQGLEYHPAGDVLERFLPTGISNVMTENTCMIEIEKGFAIVVHIVEM